MVTERSVWASYPRDNQNGVIRKFYSAPFVFLTDTFTGESLCGGDVGRGHSFYEDVYIFSASLSPDDTAEV